MVNRSHIDERDGRLLQMIDLDARLTLTEIGKRLRISKPAAKRRLERLEERGVIRRYVTIINLAALGYTLFKIHLKMSHMADEEFAAFAKHLKKIPEVGWILHCIGRWDFIIILYAKNTTLFAQTYRKLLDPVAGKVARKRVTLVASLTHLSHDSLLKRAPTVHSKVTIGSSGEVRLDSLDTKLLDFISLDARASFVKLSQDLNVSPKTIRNRIKKLEQTGVILGYNAVIDTNKIGYEHHKVSIFLTHVGDETFKKVRGYVESLPETVLFLDSLGDADLEFDVKVASTARLYKIISALQNRFTAIIRTVDTLLITDEDVRDYTPNR